MAFPVVEISTRKGTTLALIGMHAGTRWRLAQIVATNGDTAALPGTRNILMIGPVGTGKSGMSNFDSSCLAHSIGESYSRKLSNKKWFYVISL